MLSLFLTFKIQMMYTINGGIIMKKLLLILSLIVCIFTFGACSNGGTENNMNENNQQEEQVEPISSLIGTWKEIDGRSNHMFWYEAIVTESEIFLYYCDWNTNRDLMWHGTYSEPENPVTNWKFVSDIIDPDEGSVGDYREFVYSKNKLIPERVIGEPAGDSADNKIYLTKIQ